VHLLKKKKQLLELTIQIRNPIMPELLVDFKVTPMFYAELTKTLLLIENLLKLKSLILLNISNGLLPDMFLLTI